MTLVKNYARKNIALLESFKREDGSKLILQFQKNSKRRGSFCLSTYPQLHCFLECKIIRVCSVKVKQLNIM